MTLMEVHPHARTYPCLKSALALSKQGSHASMPAYISNNDDSDDENGGDTISPPILNEEDYWKSLNGKMGKALDYSTVLEMYRSNAKKSKEVQVKLGFARYLLNVAGTFEKTDFACSMMGDAKALSENGELNQNTISSMKSTSSLKESIRKRLSSSMLLFQRSSTIESCSKEPKPLSKSEFEEEAIQMIKKVANPTLAFHKSNNAEAQYFLGLIYAEGRYGKPINHRKAYEVFLKASKQNHPIATYLVAQAYELGLGTKQNNRRAITFYRKAASLSYYLAMHRLGLILLYGELGERQNLNEGVMWIKRTLNEVSEKVYPNALHDLALAYMKSNSIFDHHSSGAVIQNDQYALECFMRAAGYGYAKSQFQLGLFYQNGEMGLERDLELAVKWFTEAARQDHPEAQIALGVAYLNDWVVPLGREERIALGMEWLQKSAAQNFGKAEYLLGHIYQTGRLGDVSLIEQTATDSFERVVQIDPECSLEWYKKSLDHGCKLAKPRLASVRKLLKAYNRKK